MALPTTSAAVLMELIPLNTLVGRAIEWGPGKTQLWIPVGSPLDWMIPPQVENGDYGGLLQMRVNSAMQGSEFSRIVVVDKWTLGRYEHLLRHDLSPLCSK